MGRSIRINKSGFTLVELSIVLVIIGLLIGGILVAQSLIESAKVNSFVSQIQQYDATIMGFKDRYKQLPGDISSFPAGQGGDVGNEDGYVRGRWGTDDHLNGEISSFWNHLSLAGMVEKQYAIQTDFNSGSFPDVNYPQAKIGTNASLVVGAEGDGGDFLNENVYWVYGAPTDSLNTYSSTHTIALTIEESFAADAKMDDGKPLSGNVRKLGGQNLDCMDQTGNVLIGLV